jgi:hypothetical protein
MEFKKAERKNIPALIALAGATGSGKTFSALLVAAGLVGDKGKVAFIDTEMGRGAMYADEPLIMAALPQGYDIAELTPPYTPARYLEAINKAVKAGYNCIIIDSVTHEWEGEGGCSDMAENNKLQGLPNWAMAKREHKRFINTLLTLPVDVICCLRAREKTKPEKDPTTGKIKFVDYGVQAIQEKNFMFEMTFSLLLDDKTQLPQITKCPASLRHIFPTNQMITPEVGKKIKQWSLGGEYVDLQVRALKENLTFAAVQGNDALSAAWKALTPAEQKLAVPFKEELKAMATESDNNKGDSDE